MADCKEATKTPTHLINIRLIMIACSTIFSSNMRKWHGIPNQSPKKPCPTSKHISKQPKKKQQRANKP
jgi:hypothetical protein